MAIESFSQLEYYKRLVIDQLETLETAAVKERIKTVLENQTDITVVEKLAYVQRLEDAILKYDIVQPLLDDSDISEIMINGLAPIFVEKKGRLSQSNIAFSEKEHLDAWIQKVATEVGREVNFSKPTMDARLKDGSRVNVILDPVAVKGPIVTIRKFLCAFNAPEDLVESGMLTPALCDFFEDLFKARYNIFVAGGTGSGKTTFLNCMSRHIPSEERVIVIEDASEIKIDHIPNSVALETRQGNSQSPVTMSALIKNALRMRPDRIIVGEVRGDEALDMLQAMNTGHDGSVSTGHSNSALDMLVRLEVIASSHSDMDPALIRRQIISAVDIVVYIERTPSGKRQVSYVGEVAKQSDTYCLTPLYDAEMPEVSATEIRARMQNKQKMRRYLERLSKTHC